MNELVHTFVRVYKYVNYIFYVFRNASYSNCFVVLSPSSKTNS
jgi:hypothetical protein